MRNTICVALAAILLSTACSRPEPSKAGTARQETATKYGVPVTGGPMDGILLKDYRPASSLVVPVTEVKKARFPAIDVHSHSSMNGIRTRADVDAWVKTMDEVGIEMSVVFTGASGAEFDRQAELFLKRHPGRFQVYCSLDLNGYDQPGFSERSEIGRAHV